MANLASRSTFFWYSFISCSAISPLISILGSYSIDKEVRLTKGPNAKLQREASTMWILDVSPPRWLCPNKTYTLGRRTQKADENFITFNGMSVSRQHLTITVGSPDVEGMDQVTSIQFTDLKSRFGTKVDSKPLKYTLKSTATEHTLHLGPSVEIKVHWKPVNITYSTGEKGQAHAAMFDHAKSVLEPLDIRLSNTFTDKTTHFMKGTHVTSKLALALVRNLPVVSTQFLDAIGSVSSELEMDADKWPDETRFLEDPLWAPNLARKSCFKGLKFVVFEKEQLRSLGPVINGASGEVRQGTDPSGTEIFVKSTNRSLNVEAKMSIEQVDILTAIKQGVAVKPGPRRVKKEEMLISLADEAPAVVKDEPQEEDLAVAEGSPQSNYKRPRRAAIMDFMKADGTAESQSSSTESCRPVSQPNGDALTESRRKRPKKAPLMDFLTSNGNKPAPDSQETRKRPARVTMMDHMITVHDPTSSADTTKRHKAADEATTDIQSSPQPLSLSGETVSPEPVPSVPNEGPHGMHGQVSDEQSISTNTMFIDMEKDTKELAVIECSIEIKGAQKVAPNATNCDWTSRSNFKAFRRKGNNAAPRKQREVPIFNSQPETTPNLYMQQSKSRSSASASSIQDEEMDEEPFDRLEETKTSHIDDPDSEGEFSFKFTT